MGKWLIAGLGYGVFRRMFGSSGWHIPVLENRFIQHIFGYLVGVLSLLLCNYKDWQVLLVPVVIQGLFWAPAVGMYQDIGRAGQPDEKMEKRYNAIWYNRFLNRWFGRYKYSDLYDFVGLTIRYTLPALLIAILLAKPVFCFTGVGVACIYAFMWKLYDYKYTKDPTEYAEFVSGVFFGLMLVF